MSHVHSSVDSGSATSIIPNYGERKHDATRSLPLDTNFEVHGKNSFCLFGMVCVNLKSQPCNLEAEPCASCCRLHMLAFTLPEL